MSTGIIAKRYARALLAFATECNEQDTTYEQAVRIAGAWSQAAILREVLYSPISNDEQRIEMLRQAAGNELCATMNRFLRLVLQHHRVGCLIFILHSYIGLYKEQKGLHEAYLESAWPLSEQSLERLKRLLEAHTGGEVRLHETSNRELLGGFRLRLDDLLIDATLRRAVEELKDRFDEKRNRIV